MAKKHTVIIDDTNGGESKNIQYSRKILRTTSTAILSASRKLTFRCAKSERLFTIAWQAMQKVLREKNVRLSMLQKMVSIKSALRCTKTKSVRNELTEMPLQPPKKKLSSRNGTSGTDFLPEKNLH